MKAHTVLNGRILPLLLSVILIALSGQVVTAHAASSNPDFSISDTPAFSLLSGFDYMTFMSTGSINGYSGQVTVSLTASSSALMCQIDDTNGKATSQVSFDITPTSTPFYPIDCFGGRPAGNYTFTLTGTDGSLTHSFTVNVRLQDFTVSGPASLSFPAGSSQNETIMFTSLNGFSQHVPLKVAAPSILSVSCPVNVMLGADSSMNITCSLSSPTAGTYNVTFTGNFFSNTVVFNFGFGPPSTTSTVSVLGPSIPGFTVSATPTSLELNGPGIGLGPQRSSTLMISSVNGFSGSVALSATSSPDIFAIANPSSVSLTPGGSTNSTLIVRSTSCSLGSFFARATGTRGSYSFASTVVVTMSDLTRGYAIFNLCADPAYVSTTTGSMANTTIRIVGINQFQGTVNLGVTAPSSVNCALNPSSFYLVTTATSTLSCSSSTLKAFSVSVGGSWVNPYPYCNDCGGLQSWSSSTNASFTNTGPFIDINSSSSFDGVSVTSNGSLSVTSGLVSGTVTITAANSTSGSVLFSRVYRVANVSFSGNYARFLLVVPMNPYSLSVDIVVGQSRGSWAVSAIVTRNVDLLGHGTVDAVDIAMIIANYGNGFGSTGYNPLADLGARGITDAVDASIALFFYAAPEYA